MYDNRNDCADKQCMQYQCTHLLSMDVCWRSEFNGINGIIFNKKWMHLDCDDVPLMHHSWLRTHLHFIPSLFLCYSTPFRSINGHFMLCGIASPCVVPLRSTSHLTAFFWIVHIQLEWADCPFLVNICLSHTFMYSIWAYNSLFWYQCTLSNERWATCIEHPSSISKHW